MTTDSSESRSAPETRIAQLESELAENRAQIARLEQSWEQWLRLISHDFRGPLTLMLGYTQTVLQSLTDGPDRDQERHDLKAAVSAAQRLDKMIGEIVDAARLEAHALVLAPAEIEIAPIIRDQVQKARRRYPGRLIRTSIPNQLPFLVTDGRRVSQIVAALLSNAILFSPDNSTVSLAVRRTEEQIVIAVDDRGVGLAEEEKAHLFQKFYRQERAREVRREGLGLSLLVAEQIAVRLNGRLWVESPGPDQGSTFYLSLACQVTVDG